MKKIYLSIISVFACCTLTISQNKVQVPSQHFEKVIPGSVMKTPERWQHGSSRVQGGSFAIQLDPIEQIMTQKGVVLTGANPSVETFLTGVFQDSTTSVVTSTGAINSIDNILLGTTLDPKSQLLQPSLEAIVSNTDSYNIDSVGIIASYVKKTANTDTLYVWLVWGDTANTAVYTKVLTSSAWLSPISGWRRSVIGPKLTGATGASGNKVKPAAPASNMRLVKYVLQARDSVSQYGRIKTIPIPFTNGSPLGVTIPAGNIVSCFYTFVPGGGHTLNQPMYSFTTAVVPTINGFCGLFWAQDAPLNSLMDYQVDKNSWNMGLTYDNTSRHAMNNATFNNNAIGDPTTAARIIFSITGNSTVGLNELNKKGFVLGQNKPNPFTGESKIEYILDKEASSGMFTITDVMGRIISTETVGTTKGAHAIQIGSQAPGVYYYSLTIDGNVTTKKMIVQ